MSYLKEVKTELKEKNKLDVLSKKNKVLLEQSWFKDQLKVCTKCKRTTRLTIDHIIPKDILNQFGIDVDREFWKDNLQVNCQICNQYKGNRLDLSNPKTIILLKELIKLIE